MQVRSGYDETSWLPVKGSRSLTAWRVSERCAAVRYSVPVEADGVFLGMAVEHKLGVEFVATHAASLCGEIWRRFPKKLAQPISV